MFGNARLMAEDRQALSEDAGALYLTVPREDKNSDNFYAIAERVFSLKLPGLRVMLPSGTSYFALRFETEAQMLEAAKTLDKAPLVSGKPDSPLICRKFSSGDEHKSESQRHSRKFVVFPLCSLLSCGAGYYDSPNQPELEHILLFLPSESSEILLTEVVAHTIPKDAKKPKQSQTSAPSSRPQVSGKYCLPYIERYAKLTSTGRK